MKRYRTGLLIAIALIMFVVIVDVSSDRDSITGNAASFQPGHLMEFDIMLGLIFVLTVVVGVFVLEFGVLRAS